MESLNELIRRHLNFEGYRLERNGMELTTDFDSSLPRIYDSRDSQLEIALENITNSIKTSGAKKAFYQTAFDGELQRILVYHDSDNIPGDYLASLNLGLREIAANMKYKGPNSNYLIVAAQQLAEFGGNVIVENITSEAYTMRITVELPPIASFNDHSEM